MNDPLQHYQSKRDFTRTPEPAAGGKAGTLAPRFVIQKHWARALHYDFRLELDGALKSWAVPKGPSLDSRDKRMAVQVEDHPLAYASFEGDIPSGQYGAGKVIIWDCGSWQPQGDASKGYRDGHLKFTLHGHKLQGRWALVRMKGKGDAQPPWLLIKERDQFCRPREQFSVVDQQPDSVRHLGAAADASALATLARAAPLPATLKPQLATLVAQAPGGAGWCYEAKFDGYRLLARIEDGTIALFTRNGLDWTGRLPELSAALQAMALPDGFYDGEIVVPDERGRPDFGALQRAFDDARTGAIVYYLFDLPFCRGYDLRAVPLVQRRAMLEALVADAPGERIRFSATIDAEPERLRQAACAAGLEGLVGKRADSAYATGRTGDWIKLKCGLRQEFVIGGYTDPQGARAGLGALLLGTYDEQGALHYVGKVGSGFDDATLTKLVARLAPLTRATSAFCDVPGALRHAHWVRPALVAEVRFGAWTDSGAIRHAVFVALRKDKQARTIGRELADDEGGDMTTEARAQTPANTLPGKLKVTHGERVIDRASGVTKIDLVRYYALVAPLMLPQMKGRPLALLRAPDGVEGQLFFQKHAQGGKLGGVRELDRALDPAHPPMLELVNAGALLEAVQWNVLEFHSQNALAHDYEHPNRIVFDLDPGEGVAWKAVQDAALVLRGFLATLGLRAYLKTSGGKGLHVLVPIRPRHDWDMVKALAEAVVRRLAATAPSKFSAKSGAANRVGKIYIDYLRNGRGATTACAWSARARPGLGISVPLAWDELERVKSGDHWRVDSVHTRLDTGNAPWEGYARGARAIDKALSALELMP